MVRTRIRILDNFMRRARPASPTNDGRYQMETDRKIPEVQHNVTRPETTENLSVTLQLVNLDSQIPTDQSPKLRASQLR